MNRNFYLIAACFFVIGFMIYLPGIQGPRFADDFTVVPQGSLTTDLTKIWTTSYQRSQFYRPLEDTIAVIFIYAFGWNTLPTHILQILIHCLIVTFLFYVFVKIGFPQSAVFLGALFLLIAQANVLAVECNGAFGQLLSSLFCLISLWLIYNSIVVVDNKLSLKIELYIIAIILFVLGLLSKESSAAFLPMLLLLLFIKNSHLRQANNLIKSLIFLLPFIVTFVIFFIIRSSIVPLGPQFGSDRYDINFGLNIPKNIAMLLFSIFLPVSSVRTFEAFQLNDYGFLISALLLTVSFAAIIVYGVWKSKKLREAAVLFCFVIAGFSPNIILNHVNELYTYFSMPFAAMLIGIGLNYYIKTFNGLKKNLFIGLIVLFYLINALSVMEKVSQMNEIGKKANVLFGEIEQYFTIIQPNGALILVNSHDKGIRYSSFIQPEFEPVRYTDFMIYKLAGRNDFKFAVIEWEETDQWKNKPGVVMLKLEGDKVVRMN